ncbi:hypothetical protein E8E11_001666 [Didymella keratinophila]|nr:hypothetical protein E8E11_001666 [Didymella keratinophila]
MKIVLLDKWMYYKCQCTSFVAWRINQKLGINFHNRYQGVTVNKTPNVGSVAQWNKGYGHVAWITAVSGDWVTVDDYNWNFEDYGTRKLKNTFDNYIHLKKIWDKRKERVVTNMKAQTLSKVVVAILAVILYRLTLHPLAHYPGPFLAKITDIWLAYYAYRGSRHLAFHNAHAQFGPYVRLGPNLLSVNTATGLKTIYGFRSNVKKADFYKAFPSTPAAVSVHSAIDKMQHARKRRVMSSAFSDAAIRNLEKYILANCGTHLTIHNWHLDKLFFRKIAGQRAQYMQYSKGQAMERTKLGLEADRKDFFYYLLNAKDAETGEGFNMNELWGESNLLIIAGSDTTSTAMSGTFFYLAHNPSVLEKLCKEIRSTFSDVEEIVTSPKLSSCTYLKACIDETMRMSPPVAGALPRQVLPGGMEIDGKRIPAGVDVGVPIYAIHHNSNYYPQPFDYIPERWLTDPSANPMHSSLLAAQSAFNPFSIGPRGCIGKGLAYVELTVTIARVLYLYDLRLAPGTTLGAGNKDLEVGRTRANEYQIQDVFATAPQRHFTSSARFQEQFIQTPATGPEVPLTATCDEAAGNGIAISKLNRNTTPAEIQQLLHNAGVEVKRLQCRIDRFTFQNSTSVFVQLRSEEQVQKAVKALDGLKMGKGPRPLRVSPLADTFTWQIENRMKQRFFLHDATAASEAIQPLLEGRRYTIFVENPGWTFNRVPDKSINTRRQQILDEALEPFNVEALGGINPVWKTDRRAGMTFVAFVDFATKEDAQRAVDVLNNSIVEGKRMELRPSTSVNPQRAKQIGKVDKGVLAQLQEAGLIM